MEGLTNAIYNVKPQQYTIGNDLIYKYDRGTCSFWGFRGNEYLYFDNKDIKNAVNNILRISARRNLQQLPVHQ